MRRKRPELLRNPDETMERVADSSSDGTSAESVVMADMFDATVESAYEALPTSFAASWSSSTSKASATRRPRTCSTSPSER